MRKSGSRPVATHHPNAKKGKAGGRGWAGWWIVHCMVQCIVHHSFNHTPLTQESLAMSSPTELAHIRTTITGVRSMLSAYFYNTDAMCELMRHPGLRSKLNHECGGVMDHLANIIDALDELLDEPEPGDREPHFPAPEPTTTDSACPHCGGSMLGDGYTTVMHCERIDITSATAEPDSAPIFCDPNTLND